MRNKPNFSNSVTSVNTNGKRNSYSRLAVNANSNTNRSSSRSYINKNLHPNHNANINVNDNTSSNTLKNSADISRSAIQEQEQTKEEMKLFIKSKMMKKNSLELQEEKGSGKSKCNNPNSRRYSNSTSRYKLSKSLMTNRLNNNNNLNASLNVQLNNSYIINNSSAYNPDTKRIQ